MAIGKMWIKIARNSHFLLGFSMKNERKKNRRIYIRVTEDEYKMIKDKVSEGMTISAFILYAVAHFDDKYYKKRIDVMTDSGAAFKAWTAQLGKFANNINAIANYCNRCELLGIDDVEPVKETGKYVREMESLFAEIRSFHTRFLGFISRYKRR